MKLAFLFLAITLLSSCSFQMGADGSKSGMVDPGVIDIFKKSGSKTPIPTNSKIETSSAIHPVIP